MTEIRVPKSVFKARWPLIKQGIANDFQNVLVRTVPVDTGFLRNSIVVKPVIGGFIISMPGYAMFVEFGTPPHIIRPRRRKALSWTEGKGGGGKRFFAKKVRHPGTTPQPFIRTALNTNLRDIITQNLMRYLT